MQDTTLSVEQQAEQAMGRLVEELATAAGVAATLLGIRLGLWSALAGLPPATASEVAADTGLAEPFVREWLRTQAAGGYLDYEPGSRRFRLPAGVAAVLGVEGGGLVGALATQLSTWHADLDLLAAGLRAGRGLAWQERTAQNSEAMDAITRSVVCPALVSQWLPAMDGVVDRLAAGGRVADVGCGYGAATRAVARAFPLAEVWGFDTDEASVARARQAQADAATARARFEVATAKTFPGSGYDLITYLDTFHDLGDPLGALVHARTALRPGGAVLLVDDDACAHYELALRVHQLVVPAPPDLPRVDLVLGWAAAQHRVGQSAERGRTTARRRRRPATAWAAASMRALTCRSRSAGRRSRSGWVQADRSGPGRRSGSPPRCGRLLRGGHR